MLIALLLCQGNAPPPVGVALASMTIAVTSGRASSAVGPGGSVTNSISTGSASSSVKSASASNDVEVA